MLSIKLKGQNNLNTNERNLNRKITLKNIKMKGPKENEFATTDSKQDGIFFNFEQPKLA